ncbi:acylneuraminate cytidylyltransferase family protein [Adhaeribacter swui]|uniref:Acylneuraminate cytidylyltransferase family protein n=1 Tax=Adhaeribacter swui TaxID=2086471 RepID=A0A7G7G9H7_9BACT|nr:acylneuraminate cytidylyltransferase family protein [Adhaeribacter swui]QNF33811.1 acylneuraminate cytidylyltransferase family protein [Adhaeribacter swui]
MADLYIIPARGGSKGIPGKNIKPLNGKPLIHYTLDVAKAVAKPEDIICVSTDDDAIIKAVTEYGFKVDFKRPPELASDTAGMNEVLLHALNFYEQKQATIDKIILLQPTSPFRKAEQVKEALLVFSPDMDMVVSVKVTDANPYYVLAEENEHGYLEKSKKANFVRRQDCPIVYQYNGALYIINPQMLKSKSLTGLDRVKKYVMDDITSVDLDTPLDWSFAEFLKGRF